MQTSPWLRFHKAVVLTGLNYFLCIIFSWSLVEYFRLFMKSEREQTLLVCAVCLVSAGEDTGLEWKLLYIMCFEERWGIGLDWCGWQQYHPALSGHIKACPADGLDWSWENRGLVLIFNTAKIFLQIEYLVNWFLFKICFVHTKFLGNKSCYGMPFLHYTEWVFFTLAGLFYWTCSHWSTQRILAPIMVLFPSLTGTLTSLSFLSDRNSRNRTPFKLCVISKLAEVRKEKQTQNIRKNTTKLNKRGSPEWKPSV